VLLAIDVGNTNVVFGLFMGDEIRTRWRLATVRDRMPDEWWAVLTTLAADEGIDLHRVNAVALASVVPPLTTALTEMARARLGVEPLIVNGALDFGFPILADYPAEVGADRICNAVAAFELFGAPSVVIDFGTGTNFDVVGPEGGYIGGAIAPGVAIALDALVSRAARLVGVELKAPRRAIGRNTIECLQAGTVLGYADLVSGLIRRISAELPSPPRVIATGGLGQLMAPLIPEIERYEPDLTLIGLRLIYERVTARRASGSAAARS
jgi:type III pantothenate kinase